jgi:large subunit ribosomal protein L10
MDNPRPEKTAVVDEVRTRLDDAQAAVVTEYRGLTVADLAVLRRSLTAAGGDYKIFKNTLVRRAIDGGPHAPLEELLVGPTAIAFVHGEVSAVAKALRDFSRTNAHLVVKGGMLDGAVLSPVQLGALADLPSREVLLARMAGAIQAPLAQLAGLLQALPRNLAYGLKALVDDRGGVPGEAGSADAADVAQDAAKATPETEAATPETEAATPETEAASPETEAASPETEAASPETEAATSETEAASPETEAATPADASDVPQDAPTSTPEVGGSGGDGETGTQQETSTEGE